MSSYTESEIAVYALEVIKQNPGIRTSGLIQKLREIMKPNGEDLEILSGRNDDKFSQKVRNLKSHNSLSGLVETTDDDDDKKNGCMWFIKS